MAGKKIGGICGEQLKRFSLELGGKSAAILLDDVNLAEALPMLLPNAIMNNGEACIAQTRILAPRDRYQEVVDAIVESVSAMHVGDPLDPTVEVGPLVAERQRDRVEGYIKLGQEEGAKVAVGGGRPADMDKGWFVEPTVFVNVDNSMRIAQEEIFGPVLAVIPYDGDAEAVAIANDSSYGLCGSVYTGDPERGLGVARQCGPARTCSTAPSRSTSPPPSVGTRSRASGGSSAPMASSCSWRRSPSTCRRGSAPRCERCPRGGLAARVDRVFVEPGPSGPGAASVGTGGQTHTTPTGAGAGARARSAGAAWRGSRRWAVGWRTRRRPAPRSTGRARRGPAVTREDARSRPGWP